MKAGYLHDLLFHGSIVSNLKNKNVIIIPKNLLHSPLKSSIEIKKTMGWIFKTRSPDKF